MKYVAEFYMKKTHSIAQEIIEAESLEAAAETAEGMTTDYKSLVNVVDDNLFD
jgi:hypothetical protein